MVKNGKDHWITSSGIHVYIDPENPFVHVANMTKPFYYLEAFIGRDDRYREEEGNTILVKTFHNQKTGMYRYVYIGELVMEFEIDEPIVAYVSEIDTCPLAFTKTRIFFMQPITKHVLRKGSSKPRRKQQYQYAELDDFDQRSLDFYAAARAKRVPLYNFAATILMS